MIVSANGSQPRLSLAPIADDDMARRLLTDSAAQGLVRFDAAGQIVPGVAERWIVTDEGRTYIFRLRDTSWADGRPMRAAEVVAILRRRLQQRARNPLAPYLTALDSIVEMTPEVIQVELARPRPDLLKLFAQPDMAIIHPVRGIGSGPMQVVGKIGQVTRLRPIPDPNRAADEQEDPQPEDDVLLIAERPAAGVARFAARRSDLFTGGTVGEWPLLTAAGIDAAEVRLDPAAGLFGLAIVRPEGFLATPENRGALALAIDRAALVQAFTADWQPAEDLLPAALDSASPPAKAPWQAVPAADRRATARARVDAWVGAGNENPTVRIALPASAGGTLLWARIAADLYAVGIRPIRVAWDAEADLRLIDAVAPFDSGRWYLGHACQPCSEGASQAIEAARMAPSLAERARAIAAADRLLAEDIAFVPLARPLRWSLVAPRLRTWQANERAWHPLNGVRRDPN
ncbi:ABC transporter substrate-binding protein [Sphingomonas sp. IC-11]|uniref:ABC transporter substrate-binding protein n=1 Tax=Sphingomonas sp. IC-11 TaxID=2898528 RepID=UPI001E28BD3D|nr:ABC transporter substrate-binding protein [Sphingomonas sp. IC-11]